MKKYHGNYLGIIVQNNDPEQRGRVKIWVPHISANVYENWYQVKEDKEFKFVGQNIKSSLNDIIEPLKEILPWAECALPLVGSGGYGRYNNHGEIGTISDSNRYDTIEPDEDYTKTKYSLNEDGIGESPGRKYESSDLCLNDAFTSSQDGVLNGTSRPNKYSYNYRPSTYSNKAKGSFSIPNVGAHVWVFHEDGDIGSPVFFALAHDQNSWGGIYDTDDNEQHGVDYPGAYENVSKNDEPIYDNNTETYRNKYVLNQKGGTLEIVNTDNREILKMTHFSGSFKEFNNHTNTELATKNDQKLVLEDQYLTVNGYKNQYTGRDFEDIVKGDIIHKTGNLDTDLHKEWRLTYRPVQQVKALFETKRADANSDILFADNVAIGDFPGQVKSGTPAPCPVCSNSTKMDRYYKMNNTWTAEAVDITNDSTQGTTAAMSNGSFYGTVADAVLDQYGTPGTIFGETCPVCSGTGLSPSSMDGTWDTETLKEEANFNELIKLTTEKLAKIESKMGLGGSEVINIAKHKVESIGLAMNDFRSIRIDPVGKMYRDSVVVHTEGVFNSQKESPLIEYVHVEDLPGGSYTLNVCNRWNVQVGAGGVSMKSYGPVDVSGSLVNISGSQVNVSSENEVNIDGGKRMSLVADILTLRQRNRGQVMVDSNLGVSQNVVIGGGLHVEGEVTLHHVTAPCEIQETGETELYSETVGPRLGTCVVGGGSSAGSWPVYGGFKDVIKTNPHSHHFKNLPLHLKESNDGVRDVGKDANTSGARIPAKPIQAVPQSSKVTS